MSLQIISAAPFEVSTTLEYFDNNSIAYDYHSCGIGALEAAKNSTLLVPKVMNKDVLFIGTCGVFEGFDEMTLTSPSQVHWLPASEREGIAWSIEGTAPPFPVNNSSKWVQDLSKVTAVCSPTISKNNALPQEYNPTSTVENLELYSLIDTFNAYAKSITIILAITNKVSLEGRKQWRANFKQASKMTSDYIAKQTQTKGTL